VPSLRDTRAWLMLTALAAALGCALVAGVAFGAVHVDARDVVSAMARRLSGVDGGLGDALVMDLRMPRVVLAALVGACLAAAGTLYQALFRNPLADPYILGVSSGAGLGAAIVLASGIGASAGMFVAVPLAAFAGALATIGLVVGVSMRRGRLETLSLLLSGVAISYTLAALTSFIMVFSRQTMQQVVFWMMGGLQAASWDYVAVVAPMLLVGLIAPLAYTRELNLMLLGDERAGQLGVDVQRFKLLTLGSASLLVAAAVSVSGLIGFVGLMTPHMARLVLGPDHRLLLPASVLSGAIVMVLADLIARVVLAPIELPVGIITALLGGPFFVWLLTRAERRA
jgi:iron complex transport system permease protein